MFLGVLGGYDDLVGVGFDRVRVSRELSGVAVDDVVRSFGESLFVEAVLEDGSFRFGFH